MSSFEIPEVDTQRLHLRGFRDGDLDTYARWLADAETTRFIGDGRAQPRDEAWRGMAAVVGHWALRGFGLWAAEEKESGALIGRIGLYQPEGWPGLEAGWLVDRARWGEGFAVEGGRAALEWAFEKLGAPRVISLIHPDNAASIRVAEKLGERFECELDVRGHRALQFAIERGSFVRGQ